MIRYSPELASGCRTAFRQAGIREIDDQVRDEQRRWRSSGAGRTSVARLELARSARSRSGSEQGEDGGYHLYPFVADPRTERFVTWLGFRMRFTFLAQSFELDHAQLVIYRGELDLRPLLRAEWDFRPPRGAPHPQPHWHLYPGASGTDMDTVDARWDGLATRLHLAMCAEWEGWGATRLGAGSIHSSTPSDVGLWLSFVILTLREQLVYGLQRVGAEEDQSTFSREALLVSRLPADPP